MNCGSLHSAATASASLSVLAKIVATLAAGK